MFGNSFFTIKGNISYKVKADTFSSPCLGILFSQAGLGCPTGWALYGPFAAGISN